MPNKCQIARKSVRVSTALFSFPLTNKRKICVYFKSHLGSERLEYLIGRIQFKINSVNAVFYCFLCFQQAFFLPLPVLSFSLFHCSHCLSVSTLSLEGQPNTWRTRYHLQGSEECGILWLTSLLICSEDTDQLTTRKVCLIFQLRYILEKAGWEVTGPI